MNVYMKTDDTELPVIDNVEDVPDDALSILTDNSGGEK